MTQRSLVEGVVIPYPERLEAVVATKDVPSVGVKKGDRGLRRKPWLLFLPMAPSPDGITRYRLLDVEPDSDCWTAAPEEVTLP